MARAAAKGSAAGRLGRGSARGAAEAPAAAGEGPAESAAESAAKEGAAADVLRLRELVARVAERADVRRPVARTVLAAALDEIGAALSRGQALNLPPLGRAKVNRQTERGGAEVLVVKLRRGASGGAEGLAETSE
jgi:hypothetical protein